MQKKFKFIIFLYYLKIFGQGTLHADSDIYLSPINNNHYNFWKNKCKIWNWMCFLNSVNSGFGWVDLLPSMIGYFNCPNTASHVQSMQSNLDYLHLHYPDFSIIWTCSSGPIFYQHLYSYLPFSKLWIIWTIKPMILHKSG